MKRFLLVSAIWLAAPAARGQDEIPLYNPYERAKNGPPLTEVFHKVRPSWLLTKLRNPKHHPSARMPDFRFTEEEALDIMAFLKRTAGDPPAPATPWPPWAAKPFEELEDDEFEAMQKVVERGRAVWGDARCTICHTVGGPAGDLIGGFVDLRVGGIDLQIAGMKLERDWLFRWLKEPKDYFPKTLMPRFRFSDDDAKALVEFVLRDDSFRPRTEEEPAAPERWKSLDEPERAPRGRRLVELSRCVVCHKIEGIPEVLPPSERRPAPLEGTFEFLAHDLRCLTCHSVGGRGGTYAPDLTGEGSRLREDWIAKFVQVPDIIRPLSQQMPKFNLSREEAATAAAYLSARRRDARILEEIPGGPASPEEVARGRDLFRARGCHACHITGDGPGGEVGPSLEIAGDRLQRGYIWFHLKDPNAVNPYSAEPDLGLSDKEARTLAAYLSERKK